MEEGGDCSDQANGGVLSSWGYTVVCQLNEFALPDKGAVGDVLVLTKP